MKSSFSNRSARKPLAAATLIASMIAILLAANSFSAPNPYKPMPNLSVIHIDAPAETHPGEDLGGRIHVTIANLGTGPSAGGYTLDFVISSDRKVSSAIPVFSANYKDDALLANGRIENMPALGSEETYSFTQARLPLPHDTPIGTYFVCAFVDSHNVIDEEQIDERWGISRNTLCAPMHILPNGAGSPAPQPPVSNNTQNPFDVDKNCAHDNDEFFAAVDVWMAGDISDSHFFDVFDSWISQENICSAAADAELRIERKREQVVIRSSIGTGEMAVLIYDASGRQIFSQRSGSGRLVWNLHNLHGVRVANGLYFAKITQKTGSGVKTELKRVLILN